MGPVDWFGVVVAALAATAVLLAFRRRGSPLDVALLALVMLVPATMFGHAFARIGTANLAVKPWLYGMQSGGIALAFVIPALWVSLSRNGQREAFAREAVMWLLALCAMGLAFYIA
ncbi:MAG: hypothetical protein RIQ99_1605 [Pseudomonadota bacterium]|jgi:hypothetical protein